MKTSLYFLLFTLLSLQSFAYDLTKKNAFGLTGGRVFLTGSSEFKNEAEGWWVYGAYFRHHYNENWGIDIAATRLDYDKICTCTRSNVYDALGFYRLKGIEDLSPVVGLGLGVVDNKRQQNLHLGIRSRVGVDKAINEKISLGLMVDYHIITKMPGANKGPVPGDIDAIVPKIELTWYFGN
jgi:hypothetical protein